MRETLSEWYQLDETQRSALLENGLIAFDTSSLLTLYRLSAVDRQRIVDLLEVTRDRIWLPYRAAFEFHRNRLTVVREQLDAYDEVKKRIRGLRGQIVDSVRAHPVLSQSAIRRELQDRLASIERYLEAKSVELHPEDIRDPYSRDGVLDVVTELFEGKVGARYGFRGDLQKEGQDRFDQMIPPGYEDLKKPVPDRYGDFYLWNEILEHWGSSGQAWTGGLILITEETKPDWWLTDGRDPKNQKLVGPRPELVREAAELGLAPFWMLSLRRFYERASEHLGWAETRLGEYVAVDEERTRTHLNSGSEEDGPLQGEEPTDVRFASDKGEESLSTSANHEILTDTPVAGRD